MPYSSGNQGVNISSGIGAGEAQVFTPFVQAPAYTAKDYIDLYDKKKKEDEAKAAAIAKAQQEAGKAKADTYEKTSKLLLSLKDKPLLPGYQKHVQEKADKLMGETFAKIYSDPTLDDNQKQIAINQEIYNFGQKVGEYAAASAEYKKINENVNKAAKDGGETINYDDTFGTIIPDDVEKFHEELTNHNLKVKSFSTTNASEELKKPSYYDEATQKRATNITGAKGEKTGFVNVTEIQKANPTFTSAYKERVLNNIDFTIDNKGNLKAIPFTGSLDGADAIRAVFAENQDLLNSTIEKDENGTPIGFNNDKLKELKALIGTKIDSYISPERVVKTETLQENKAATTNVTVKNPVTVNTGQQQNNQEETLALEFSKGSGMTAKGTIRDIYNAPLSQTSRFALIGSQATPISLSVVNTMSGLPLETADINGHTFTGTNYTVGLLDNTSKAWAKGMHTTLETDNYIRAIIDAKKIKSKDQLYNLLVNNKDISRKLIHLTGNLTWEDGKDKIKKTVEVAIPLVNAISNMTPTTKAKTATKTTPAQENKYTNKEYLGIVNAAANTLWDSYQANPYVRKLTKKRK